MKQRYRVFRRGWGTFYCEDLVTKKQETLKTRDKDEAFRLVAAKNETARQASIQSSIGAGVLEGGRSRRSDAQLADGNG